MKYLQCCAISVLFFLAMIHRPISINFWHKKLFEKESYTKEKLKKRINFGIVIWVVFTIGLFIFITFFVD